MKTIKDLKNVRGKTALVRVDFNTRNVRHSTRLPKTLPTIELLLEKGVKVVLAGHRGRPTKIDKSLSMKVVIPFLKKNLKSKITFLPTLNLKKNKRVIESGSGVFVLENLRFDKGEEKNSKGFSKSLASLADFYVNEAFSNSHRDHASMTGVQKFLPSYAGLLLEAEVKNLSAARKGTVFVLGGGKALSKFEAMTRLYPKAKKILLGGIVGNTFLKANGVDVKRSVYEPKILRQVKKFLSSRKIILPTDWLISSAGIIKDIGPLTSREFVKEILAAKRVVWSGPLGVYEDKRFKGGSVAIAKAMAKTKGFAIVGGGETSELLKALKLDKKVNFLSTGGGAMLAYLADQKFKAIEMIK